MNYKAAILTADGKFEIVEKDVMLNPNEALLKVEACAVCGSDVRIRRYGNDRVKYPAVLGHEVAGVIVQDRSGRFKVGSKYAIGADVPCGKCEPCKRGRGNLCTDNLAIGYQIDGGFAEYMVLTEPVVTYGPVHEFTKVTFEEAALAEPLGCAINGIEKVGIKLGDTVAIYGIGPVGCMLGELAFMHGASHVVGIDPNENRRKKSYEVSWGVAFDQVVDRTNETFDVVITANSSPECQQLAFDKVNFGGRINFFGGLASHDPRLIKTNDIHYKELTVVGSHGSTVAQHMTALKLIESGRINTYPYVTSRHKLTEIDAAFEKASSYDGFRAVVMP
jgi:L-iditol 2-dehydrogenase